MSAFATSRNDSLLDDLISPHSSVCFPGGDVDLLESSDDQELIMGNLIMRSEGGAGGGGGAADRAGNLLNDSDSFLLMSEMENAGNDEEVASVADCASRGARGRDDHCHGPLPLDDLKSRNQLIAVSCCCFFFMVAEIVGGLIANSLAIATDATHLACDLAGFLVSLFAIWISKKPPTRRMSFGYYRAEVVGALISVLLIWALTAVLVMMAIHRVQEGDYEIEGIPMIITASLGVFFNIVMGVVLHSGFTSCNIRSAFGHGHSHGGGGHGHSHSHEGHGHSHSHGGHGHSHSQGHGHSHNHGNSHRYTIMPTEDVDYTFSRTPESTSVAMRDFVSGEDEGCHSTGSNGVIPREGRCKKSRSCFDVSDNLNVRAAFVHVVGDFLQSIGVFIAALIIIIKPEYKMADPICTFVFSVLVLCTTVSVLKDVLFIILEGVPSSVSYQEVKSSLMNLPGVKSVHGLNIWSITVDKIALNVHLAVCNPKEDWDKVLKSASSMLRTRHNIFLPTIQVEPYDDAMKQCARCARP